MARPVAITEINGLTKLRDDNVGSEHDALLVNDDVVRGLWERFARNSRYVDNGIGRVRTGGNLAGQSGGLQCGDGNGEGGKQARGAETVHGIHGLPVRGRHVDDLITARLISVLALPLMSYASSSYAISRSCAVG